MRIKVEYWEGSPDRNLKFYKGNRLSYWSDWFPHTLTNRQMTHWLLRMSWFTNKSSAAIMKTFKIYVAASNSAWEARVCYDNLAALTIFFSFYWYFIMLHKWSSKPIRASTKEEAKLIFPGHLFQKKGTKQFRICVRLLPVFFVHIVFIWSIFYRRFKLDVSLPSFK